MPIYRADVFFVKLGPTRGHELNDKRRPVVVVSVNDYNSKPLVITVVPGSTFSGKRLFANEVKVEPTVENGLTYSTVFKCLQIKALDHSRFEQDRVGKLSAAHLKEIENAIRICLGLT
jgi:mRNA interferase MazF